MATACNICASINTLNETYRAYGLELSKDPIECKDCGTFMNNRYAIRCVTCSREKNLCRYCCRSTDTFYWYNRPV